jgi:aspartate kinase
MKIFKFGGASVKDAPSIKNVVSIIANFSKEDRIFVVVSAIGKTTNFLETIVKHVLSDASEAKRLMIDLVATHKTLAIELFEGKEDIILFQEFDKVVQRTHDFIDRNESPNYNFIYDQIVSQGEVLSSLLLNAYISYTKLESTFINARNLIKTDNNYTDANILWDETETAVKEVLNSTSSQIMVTQGFIGSNVEMLYTTLGREGSDYTAAILAYTLKADELTIWKDVKGVYTADPKKFPEAKLIEKLSYKEAIEMTFYGAQIIHPKTIKPIQNANCILNVRSFIDKDSKGTQIGNFEIEKYNPVIVLKENQVLYTFSVKDFSFLNETNLGKIIETFGKYSLRINLMQNTAIEFIVCTDEKIGKNEFIISALGATFDITIEKNLKLLSIRHFNEDIISKLTQNEPIFISQRNPNTVQYLIR